MILFQEVFKKYADGTEALRDVNLEIKPKEFVFVVGSSGAGKTTLLRLVVREEVPTSGKVFVDGDDIAALKDKDIPELRRKVGYIFQDYKLLAGRNAFDNVAFSLEVVGKSDDEINRIVPKYLEMVGLLNKIKSFPYQLSGGERQRLAIARALVHEPKIILADESTGMIDPSSTWEIVKLLDKVNSWGTTVVMATHDFNVVNLLKKRVVEINDGEVVRDEKSGLYEPRHSKTSSLV
ncbi:cell division ATP-binding protein FtsE [candidate division WWE3 bacterium CG08_land_8_20_14_0_20_40_13]|uniref:Cell division ATP-binding protein FtsE n=1 Tax=candidate division WWE3 bacterium CG08_land_8_20_14_0_20_40_13 TaxID=1975084 RepID=A0A2H0XDU0_UNCKA|nr:MAG: cell division ATP-binding protein FtsE [candidate division WWE3 bacterium CG08_land_8_20_14_0_20_40_13]